MAALHIPEAPRPLWVPFNINESGRLGVRRNVVRGFIPNLVADTLKKAPTGD